MIVEGFRPRHPCPTVTLPVRPEGQDRSHGSRVSKGDDRFGVSAYVTVPVVPHDQSRRCNGLPISIVKRTEEALCRLGPLGNLQDSRIRCGHDRHAFKTESEFPPRAVRSPQTEIREHEGQLPVRILGHNGPPHADAPCRATDRSQPPAERDAPSPPHENGFTISTPAGSKSFRLRVTTTSPCASAVAAIRLSLTGIDLRRARSPARSSAQRSPISASNGTQWIRRTTSSNQSSRASRPRPGPSNRMPNQISPSTTGFTAMSSSWARSHPITLGLGFGFVVSERTFVSTRYLIVRLLESRTLEVRRRLGWNRDEPTLLGAGQQQVYQPQVRRHPGAREAIDPWPEPLNFKLLAGSHAVAPTKLGRKDELSFG